MPLWDKIKSLFNNEVKGEIEKPVTEWIITRADGSSYDIMEIYDPYDLKKSLSAEETLTRIKELEDANDETYKNIDLTRKYGGEDKEKHIQTYEEVIQDREAELKFFNWLLEEHEKYSVQPPEKHI